MTERKFRVPAAWMKINVIGPYKIVPCVNPSCPTERVTKDWLFYRLLKDGEFVSDHGNRAGAIYAARNGLNLTLEQPR